MGMFHSAYLAYGVRIPDTSEDDLDAALRGTQGVSHLHAGGYDRDATYLVADDTCTNAALGKPQRIEPAAVDPAQCEAWNTQLAAAMKAVGFTPTVPPAWLLIADVS
jgi:hypothetical protein